MPLELQTSKPAPPLTDAPKAGEQSGVQTPPLWNVGYSQYCGGFGGSPWGLNMFGAEGALGVNANWNGFGYSPSYGNPYFGSPWTYRWMLEHPKIRHARTQVIAPCMAARWQVGLRDGAPEEWKKFIADMFLGQRAHVFENGVRCIDYGWTPFESIWEIVKGVYAYECAKPMLVDVTTPLVDPYGKFAGLVNHGPAGMVTPELVANGFGPNKSWICTFDGEAGYLRGRSMLENIRLTAWKGWLDTLTQLFKAFERLTGLIPVMTVPAGEYPTGNTNPDGTSELINLVDEAEKRTIPNMQRGMGVVIASLAPMIKPGMDPKDIIALLAASATKFEKLDFGTIAPAIGGYLQSLEYFGALMFEGYLISPRTGTESKNGSRADSETHTDTAVLVSQQLCSTIDHCFNRGPVDQALVLRYGIEAKGGAWLETPSLIDDTKDRSTKLLMGLAAADKGLAARIADCVDMDQTIKDAGLKSGKAWADTEAVEEKTDAQADPQNPGQLAIDPKTGKSTVNGKPNVKGRLKALLEN